jgi:hypothetical protein
VIDFKNAMVSNDISDARLTELYDIAVILHPSILDAPIWWNSLTNRLSARPKDSLTVTGIDPIDVRSPTAAYFSTLDRHKRILLANRIFTFEADNVGLDVEGRFLVKSLTTWQLFSHILSRVVTDVTILLDNMRLLVDQHMQQWRVANSTFLNESTLAIREYEGNYYNLLSAIAMSADLSTFEAIFDAWGRRAQDPPHIAAPQYTQAEMQVIQNNRADHELLSLLHQDHLVSQIEDGDIPRLVRLLSIPTAAGIDCYPRSPLLTEITNEQQFLHVSPVQSKLKLVTGMQVLSEGIPVDQLRHYKVIMKGVINQDLPDGWETSEGFPTPHVFTGLTRSEDEAQRTTPWTEVYLNAELIVELKDKAWHGQFGIEYTERLALMHVSRRSHHSTSERRASDGITICTRYRSLILARIPSFALRCFRREASSAPVYFRKNW